MDLTRRDFLRHTAAGVAGAALLPRLLAAEAPKPKLGTCHASLAQAKQSGLDGIQAYAGGPADVLDIATPARIELLKRQMGQTGLQVCSIMMGLLNDKPLATEPRSQAWLEQCVDAAKALGAKVILVAFFGKGDLRQGKTGMKKDAVEAIIPKLKAVAPKAADAGVILGLENTITAQCNLEIIERVGSPAVQVYYDVFNLTGCGYDVVAEVKALGNDRLCEFHFKNGNQYLGEGKLKWEPVAEAMQAIKYDKWIVLETSNPSKDVVADDRRNADYIRKLFGLSTAA